ncbi:tRNA (cytidine(34)-2'-O)-methyltransferase [Kocuria sp. JC486]|uniref:tRNA (cytidine(34)-2'-O)-methyltransferase n=1 Tax=Kocuria sp. JC486 TaxID=1970736 RepID=UPI00141FA7ED|nr:tRNA (cytidine(34)-2'-O)-methyltransferase [Kocuria sp. JC486]NHU84464.1 tRNA (cytidine(34)-2'-O)-methyltransferase [Kocuria sp. JC486]
MLRILFVEPEIPGNTGNAIRLAAVTGAELHIVEPIGFNFDDAHLRRAGLDYHDLAVMTVHPDLESAWAALQPNRVFAFTTTGVTPHTEVQWREDDVLMFGKESQGLSEEHKTDPHVTQEVRIPMLAARRSLNLANAASIGVYEAWRQLGFTGAKL